MRILAFVLCALAAGCSGSSEPSPEPSVVGNWGGTEASLTLTRSGGDLSYICGAGTIDGNWTLGSDGRFAATGQHFFGGGPIPAGGRPPHPVTYSGKVEADRLTLSVFLTDLMQTLGPFHLLRGGPVVVELCV